MRKMLVLMSAILVLAAACSPKNESSNISSDTKEVEEVPAGIEAEVLSFNFEDATEQADLIAEVTIIEKIEEVRESPMPHTVFKAVVKEAYKGNVSKEEITIKQQGDSEWIVNDTELFEVGDEYIFFLKETKSIAADYWIIGEETGMFKILDNKMVMKLMEPIEELKEIEVSSLKSTNSLSSEQNSELNQMISFEGFVEKIQTQAGRSNNSEF